MLDSCSQGLLANWVRTANAETLLGHFLWSCHTASVWAVPFRLDAAVVYIDTEMKFKEKRLIQIMKARLPGATSISGPEATEHYLHTLGKRVHVIQPKTGTHIHPPMA